MEFLKPFMRGEIVLNDNVYIKAIPLIIFGSIKVMRIDENGREILLYYLQAGRVKNYWKL